MPKLRRRNQQRLRFQGRWALDTASALGGLYLEDDSGDDLARDVKLGLETLLVNSTLKWPRSGDKVGRVLAGAPDRSPSVVWHAQAVGALLEFGYLPTAESVRLHIDALRGRLDEETCVNPEDVDVGDPWILRTRHVAWALACLAELNPRTIPAEDIGREAAVALEAYETVALQSLRYLTEAVGPGSWIAIREGEEYWAEFWGQRRPNLLNTIYAAIAICRASRHGLPTSHSSAWERRSPVEATIHSLVDQISVVCGQHGPRTHLDGYWLEPWAAGELPCGVVGLLGILLNEYAHLLLGVASVGSPLEERARWAHILGRRLAHDLISRKHEWVSGMDAFSYAGAEHDWWIVPSYSTCLRAVLELGAVAPTHPVIEEAFATIRRFAKTSRAPDGSSFETWGDPMRTKEVEGLAYAEHPAWHAHVDLVDIAPEICVATASSIHASGMAYGALRRAFHAADPRSLHPGLTDHVRLPSSPFTSLAIDAAEDDWMLTLSADGVYHETVEISRGRAYLLYVCSNQQASATNEELAQATATISDAFLKQTGEAPTRLIHTAEGVRAAIRELHEQLGVEVLKPGADQDGTHMLPVPLDWRATVAPSGKKRLPVRVRGRAETDSAQP